MATYPPLIIVPNQTGKLIGQNYSTQFFALHTGQSDYYMTRYLSSSVGPGENKERTEEAIDLSRQTNFLVTKLVETAKKRGKASVRRIVDSSKQEHNTEEADHPLDDHY